MKFNYKIEIILYIEDKFYIVWVNLELIHIFFVTNKMTKRTNF